MDTIEKINTGMPVNKVSIKSKPMKKKSKRTRKIVTIAGLVLLFFIIMSSVAGFAVYTQGMKVKAKAMIANQTARELKDAAQNQNLELSWEKIQTLEQNVQDVSNEYNKMAWLGLIPFVRSYYRDGQHGISAGKEFIQAGKIAIEEIKPYADLLGLSKGDSSFVNQSADKRIETAVNTFSKVTPKLKEIADHLDTAKSEFNQIDPNHYPEKVGDISLRKMIVSGKTMGDSLITFFVSAQPLLSQMPKLLGNEGERKYLLLFQNDKELRSTGGFITAYAILTFNKGKMKVITSDDIYKLDERQTKKIAAYDEIKKYHKGVFYAYLRDSNTSPDFKKSMEQFQDLYDTVSGKESFDGIIAMDTEVLVRTINALDGDIFVPEYSTNFTTKPDNRCDGCPQVIYELEEYADKPVGYARGERKDILGKLMLALMQKSLGVSPSIYWGKLSQTLLDLLNEKHVLITMKDQNEQEALESVNFAGRIQDFDGDYLHINDTNFAGAKSNMFVKHTVKQDIEIDKNGKVIKTITIDYKNPSKPSNCNLESGQLCLNGLLRNWLRIYVPLGSKLIDFKGSQVDPIVKEDLGKTVFEGYNEIAPMGSSQVVIRYELPFSAENTYPLLIQKQPGTAGHEYIITINGREKDRFQLTTDKEVNYNL